MNDLSLNWSREHVKLAGGVECSGMILEPPGREELQGQVIKSARKASCTSWLRGCLVAVAIMKKLMRRLNSSTNDLDPVERCRQARREMEQQFATFDEFFDWLYRLDQERLAKERQAPKDRLVDTMSPTRRMKKNALPRKSVKHGGRSK